jgi:hypothetical protein
MSAFDSQRTTPVIFGGTGTVFKQIGRVMTASHAKSMVACSSVTGETVVLITAGIHTPVKSQTTALGPMRNVWLVQPNVHTSPGK